MMSRFPCWWHSRSGHNFWPFRCSIWRENMMHCREKRRVTYQTIEGEDILPSPVVV